MFIALTITRDILKITRARGLRVKTFLVCLPQKIPYSESIAVRRGPVHESTWSGAAQIEIVQIRIGGVRHARLGQRHGGRHQQPHRVVESSGRLRADVDNGPLAGAELRESAGAAARPGAATGSS